MPAISPDLDFLALVKKSGLLSEEAIEAFATKHPEVLGDPNTISQAMLKLGLITTFQSKVLLSGKYRGFIMGPYKILEPIGKGGMGKIFLGEHTSLKRRVAIKVLPVDKANNEELLQRFFREARAAAALDHPNIVRLFDVNQGAGTHFLVMEYVPGKTLRQIVAARGSIPYHKAINFIIQTATGLKHAHEKGFVHRDIKPDNLILSTEGIIKILDMGLARSLTEEQDNVTKMMNPNAIYGSIDYISPEQAIGGDVDARSDLYSLGATLFALITGNAPFSGTSAQILVSHQMAEVPNLAQFKASVPPPVNAIVTKMMAKQKEQRYQSAAEVIDALLPWLSATQNSQTLVSAMPISAVDTKIVKASTEDTTVSGIHPKPRKFKKKAKASRFAVSPGMALGIVFAVLGLAVLVMVLMLSGTKPGNTVEQAKVEPARDNSNDNKNYVSTTPRTDVVADKCVFLDLQPVTNVVSTLNIFLREGDRSSTNSIELPKWGRVTYHGVPFHVIDPQGTKNPNIIIFQGGDNEMSQARRASARIVCNTSAKTIHVLGGISGLAYPFISQRMTAMLARLQYADGQTEDHELINGTHFADWRMPHGNVPSLPVVAQFDKERHLRYFSINPKRSVEISTIELIKSDNVQLSPIFFAITVEKP